MRKFLILLALLIMGMGFLGNYVASLLPNSFNSGGFYLVIVTLLFALAIIPSIASTRLIRKKYPKESIVQIMNERKSKTIYIAVAVCTAFLLFSTVIPFVSHSDDIDSLRSIILIMMVLLLSRKLAIDYRIIQGWYGNNEWEVREIIDFIIRESNNIDFRDGGKLKKILTDRDLEEIKSMVLKPASDAAD